MSASHNRWRKKKGKKNK
ncbi:rCG50434, isoform CRA_c [Rattus norvegicus]|uniref:RCG50434, isoform CRA_c n=1 Tax=Rattus norvegicus TaxID=10116 RepID=A6JYZ4_RAT|nr:rCG50434, isoform CRA_c [Rattus norvegicus]